MGCQPEKPVIAELLTISPVHHSPGDLAIQLGTIAGLARCGVACVPVLRPSGQHPLIVGGGHVIGPGRSLMAFRVPGPHLLNAVTAHAGEYPHLAEYRYLSVRDAASAALIPGAKLVPCPATLLRPLNDEWFDGWPCYGNIPRARGRTVVHNHPLLTPAADHDSLIVDPQPWAAFHWGGKGILCPPTPSPHALMWMIAGAKCVVTCSLHLGILALCAGVPVVAIDAGGVQGQKVRGYWERAGAGEIVVDRPESPKQIDWEALLARERDACHAHFEEMSRILCES